MRMWLEVGMALGVAASIATACGGRTLTAGAGGEGAYAATGGGGTAAGGSGHGGGGIGGSSSSSTSSSTGSSTGSSTSSGTPIDCLACIGTSCPEAMACIQDSACVQGMVCAVSQCLGGGSPDMMCVLDCFNGDMQAAMLALNTITCIFGSCGPECAGLLPGGPPGG